MNNTNPTISIIIPVYNEETRLPRCVNSLLSQTYEDIEIIIVDDGSCDGSQQLIEQLRNAHVNIKALFLDHGGAMQARLRGVELASGKWIGFADADDTADSRMYECLFEAGSRHDADIVLCGYKQFYPDGRVLTYFSSMEETLLDQDAALRALLSYEHCEMWSPCTKIFKRELLTDSTASKLCKITIKHYEDMLMNYHIMKNASRIVSIPKCFYHYRIRYDSTSFSDSPEERFMDELMIREMILEDSNEHFRPVAKSFFLQACTKLYSELRTVYKANHPYCVRVLNLIIKHR